MNPFKGMDEAVEDILKNSRRVVPAAVLVVTLLALLLLSGCASLKEAGWVSGAALTTGAVASTATGTLPAVAAAAAAGGLTAAVVSDGGSSASPENVTNAWGALAVLFSTSAKWIAIAIIVFIVVGWLVPSPFRLNRKNDSAR